jgi:hypothetical protein
VPWEAEDWDGLDGGAGGGRIARRLDPVQHILRYLPDRERKTIGDLGHHRVARLPLLESLFQRVLLVDVDRDADVLHFERRHPMLESGSARCTLEELGRLRVRLDVTVAIDALASPGAICVDASLGRIHATLAEGGLFVATFPALAPSETPFPMQLGSRAHDGERAFHEVELQYRLQRAGFQGIRLRRVGAGERSRILCMAVRRAWN